MTREERIKAFEKLLDNAWKDYGDRGAATVDALEDNAQELAFAKGFRYGYEQALEHPTGGDLLYVLNKGCAQGYKDAVDKACEWIRANHDEIFLRYLRGDSAEYEIELFKKAMEEQE